VILDIVIERVGPTACGCCSTKEICRKQLLSLLSPGTLNARVNLFFGIVKLCYSSVLILKEKKSDTWSFHIQLAATIDK